MKDKGKTQEQLIQELKRLRRRVTELEAPEARHMAQEITLNQANEEKETILDSLVEHVVYHDMEMRILWANQAACDSVGMTREELVGCHCYEIWAKRSDLCEDCPVKSARETGQPQALEKTTPDGRSWYIHASPVRGGSGDIVGMVELTLDITEQKRTEQVLRQSEEQYRQLVETMNEGLAFGNQDYIFTFVNERLCQILGYPMEEIVGRHLIEFVHDDYKESMKDQMARRRRGEQEKFELAWSAKDGRKIYTIASPKGLYDAEGNFAGSLAVLTDITVRRQLEEALRTANVRAKRELEKLVEERTVELVKANEQLQHEIKERKQADEALAISEGKYRLLVHSADEGIVVSQDGIIKFVNPKAVEISGRSEEELISKQFIEFVHPGDRETLMDHHSRRLSGEKEPKHYDFRIVDKADNIKWVRNNGVITDWQGRPATLNLLSDITQNKLREEQLIKTERLLFKTFDALQDLLIVVDKDLRVVMSNWKDHDYISQEEREGHPYCYACFMCRDTPCEPCHVLEVFATGEMRELEQTNPFDGKTREIRVLPIFGDDGHVIMVVEHLRDVTVRKQAEKHIGRLSQELIKAQEIERQRIAGDLHDHLAQDLATLKINLDTLYAHQLDTSDDRRQRVFELSKLTQNIIMAIRDMAYGLHPPSLKEFGLVYAARQYCEEFAGKHGLQVDFLSVGMDDPELDFDIEIALYRMVQEGLANIEKHAGASHVNVRLSASVSHIRLYIEDNGKGFEANNRLKAAVSEKRLGIWGMEQRAAFLKGEMKIESDLMHGTKILIKVPYMDKTNG